MQLPVKTVKLPGTRRKKPKRMNFLALMVVKHAKDHLTVPFPNSQARSCFHQNLLFEISCRIERSLLHFQILLRDQKTHRTQEVNFDEIYRKFAL